MKNLAAVFAIIAYLMVFAPLPSLGGHVENQSIPKETHEASTSSMEVENAVLTGHREELSDVLSSSLLANSSDETASGIQILQSEKKEGSDEPGFFREIADGFYSRITVVGFATVNGVVDDSTLNMNNRLDIPRYQAVLSPRPDFYLDFRQLELGIKPRWEVTWQKWEDGIKEDERETDDDLFVLEWLSRLRLHNTLFVSYGRENLQWGPSYLLSPSNPFNQNNGRNEPNVEVRGLDYGRLVWIPSSAWAISAIANTGEGAADIEEFERTYALKLDYTGQKKYLSLVPSYREEDKERNIEDEFRFGFYGGLSIGEPLLVYGEGSISDKNDENEFLAGLAYTLEMGPTIAVEYFYQEDGCKSDPLALCFSGVAGDTRDILNRADPFLRQNYGLLQYSHSQIWDRLNINLRWIHGFDDQSDWVIGFFECELGNHTQVFFLGNSFLGDDDTEYGSFLDYSVTLGARFTF